MIVTDGVQSLYETGQSGAIDCFAMLQKIERFLGDEDGAAKVDWIVGPVKTVDRSAAAVKTVQSGMTSLSQSISSAISSKTVSNGDAEG